LALCFFGFGTRDGRPGTIRACRFTQGVANVPGARSIEGFGYSSFDYQGEIMIFKYVIAVIRPDILKEVEVRLGPYVRGMMVTKVMGSGGYTNFMARDLQTEHVKIEIFAEESTVDAVVRTIMETAHSDIPGAGVVAVLPMERFLHVRTGSEVFPNDSHE
jgi:nitrogen regulatory protein PII